MLTREILVGSSSYQLLIELTVSATPKSGHKPRSELQVETGVNRLD